MADLAPLLPPIEYDNASPEVRAVYDDIMATRGSDWINDFWKVLAHDPAGLKRTWESLKQVMAPGALDPMTKELIYIAVSATNGCEYCTYSHTASARAKGMTDAMLMEVLAVTGMANETNRLVNGLRVPVDERLRPKTGRPPNISLPLGEEGTRAPQGAREGEGATEKP